MLEEPLLELFELLLPKLFIVLLLLDDELFEFDELETA